MHEYFFESKLVGIDDVKGELFSIYGSEEVENLINKYHLNNESFKGWFKEQIEYCLDNNYRFHYGNYLEYEDKMKHIIPSTDSIPFSVKMRREKNYMNIIEDDKEWLKWDFIKVDIIKKTFNFLMKIPSA